MISFIIIGLLPLFGSAQNKIIETGSDCINPLEKTCGTQANAMNHSLFGLPQQTQKCFIANNCTASQKEVVLHAICPDFEKYIECLDPFLSCLRSFPLKLTNGSDANIDAIIGPVHQECASLAKLPTQSADAMDAAAPSSSTLQSSGFTAQSRIAVFGLLLFMI